MNTPITQTAETLAEEIAERLNPWIERDDLGKAFYEEADKTMHEQSIKNFVRIITPLLLPHFTRLAASEKALGECVKALELILKQTKEWNSCVESIIGKQPQTGIETTQPYEALALAKQHLSS